MLQSLLAEGRPLLADGATGTNLFAMGLTSGDSPELWNAEHPDRIESLHRSFVDAGSDIILTNSFGANRRRLMLHNLESRTRELNRLAAGIARKVADDARRPIMVAGSVGPTGDLLVPLGSLSEDEAVDVFIEQIEGLREGGADVAWIETMSAPEEMRAAAVAAGKCGMPYTVTASFDTARGVRRSCPGFRSGAYRLRRELRRRRLGSPGRDPWDGARRDADRQGQCGRAAMAWGGNPLFRHPGAHGGLRGARGGLRRTHRRRLLRQQPGSCRGYAARPRRP
jgi:Homocysteine S-methyltransferase